MKLIVATAVGWLGILSSCKQLRPNRRFGIEANLRLAIEAAGVALWSWNVDNDKLTMDEGGYHLWGVPISEFVSFEESFGPYPPSGPRSGEGGLSRDPGDFWRP